MPQLADLLAEGRALAAETVHIDLETEDEGVLLGLQGLLKGSATTPGPLELGGKRTGDAALGPKGAGGVEDLL